jgi:hypothetical protein
VNSKDLETEELLISESVGLTFHGLDFVIGPFQGACRNGVVVAGEDSHGMKAECLGEI